MQLTDITLPKADNDLLMFAPSLRRSPVAPVLSALSEPKKRCNLLLRYHFDKLHIKVAIGPYVANNSIAETKSSKQTPEDCNRTLRWRGRFMAKM